MEMKGQMEVQEVVQWLRSGLDGFRSPLKSD